MDDDRLIEFSSLDEIREISTDYTRFGNDYIFARIGPESRRLGLISVPVRAGAHMFCLLLKGDMSIEINTRRLDLKPISIFSLSSSSRARLLDVDWDDLDAYMLFLSREFMQDLLIDHNNIRLRPRIDGDYDPVIDNLSDNEIAILSELLDLLHRNASLNTETVFTHNVSKSLIQALVYQVLQIHHDHTRAMHASDRPVARRITYVQDFMHLVQTHYHRERSLQFYADRLFISPKYMSRIIKEATGRSAAGWIDHFVVQEAKNMLRFSGKSIQQVAYALNFPTQSSFGKFFKHITGMSPSEYQQS